MAGERWHKRWTDSSRDLSEAMQGNAKQRWRRQQASQTPNSTCNFHEDLRESPDACPATHSLCSACLLLPALSFICLNAYVARVGHAKIATTYLSIYLFIYSHASSDPCLYIYFFAFASL